MHIGTTTKTNNRNHSLVCGDGHCLGDCLKDKASKHDGAEIPREVNI